MKWSKKSKRINRFVLGGTLLTLVSTATALSALSFQNTYNTTSSTSSDTNSTSVEDNNEFTTLANNMMEAQKSASLSKELTADINYVSPLTKTTDRIIFSNGDGRPVLEFYANGNDIYARSPNELKILTTNPSNISNSEFNISIKSFNNSKYSFTNSGFSENTYSEQTINWTVQQETYAKPSLGNEVSSSPSSYIVFDNALKTTTGIKVGSLTNGYVEVSIGITNQVGYTGPNRINSALGYDYSQYLSITNSTRLEKTFVFSKDSDGNINAIYNTDVIKDSNYTPDFSLIQSSDIITASEYLRTKLSSIPITVTSVYKNQQLPKVYGYANDASGELNIAIIPPYGLENNTSSISVKASNPILYTISGFKKSNSSSSNNSQVYLKSSEISMINSSISTNNIIDTTLNSVTSTNKLSPFSKYNFSILNGNVNIQPNKEVLESTNTIISDFYRDNNLMNWDLVNSNIYPSYFNAGSSFSENITSYLPKFKYGNQYPAIQVSSIYDKSSLHTSDPISYYLNDYSGSYVGPLVVDNSTDGFSIPWEGNAFANYFAYLNKIGMYASNANKYKANYSYQSLDNDNRAIILKSLFGASLPKLNSNSSSAVDYLSNLNQTGITKSVINSNNELSNSQTISNLVGIIGDDMILLGDGSLVLMDANKSNTDTSEPYLINPSVMMAWNDAQGRAKLALDSFSIFSSIENYNYNKELGFNNEKFGSTAFEGLDENLGISNNGNVSATDFINNEENYKNILLKAYNSPIANIDNSDVLLIADDVNGKVTVQVKPYLHAEISNTFFNYGVTSEQDLINLDSWKLASLFDINVNSNSSGNIVFEFEITGFKKTSGSNDNNSTLENNFFNPTNIYVSSKMIGTDYEENLAAITDSAGKLKFQKWFVANAIKSLEIPLVYFDPKTSIKCPSFFNSEETSPNGMYTSFNEEQFDAIIESISLIQSDKYNSYTYKVTFKPNTTYTIYNDLNSSSWSTNITINTSGSYSNWIANDFISTGVDEWKTDGPDFTKINPTDYITNYGRILTSSVGTINVSPYGQLNEGQYNFLRFFQNMNLLDDPSKINISEGNSILKMTYNNMPYWLGHSSPVIFGYDLNYGYKFNADGTYRTQIYDTIQDFSSWSVTVAEQTEDGINLKVTPRIWKENGKFITQNVNPFTITFGDMIEITENKTTSIIDGTSLKATDSYLTASELKISIDYKNASYRDYVNRVKELILNLPTNAVITLKVDKTKWEQYKQEYSVNGYLDVEVYIDGEWYQNSETPIPITGGPKHLGTIRITDLKKAKLTIVKSNVTIPDIDSLVQQGIVESDVAQSFWMYSYQKYKAGETKDKFSDSFANYLADKIFIDPYISTTNPSDTTHIEWDLSTSAPEIFFDNTTGSLRFEPKNTKVYGKYYNGYGATPENANGFKISTAITITGFKKVENITEFTTGSVSIPSLIGTDLTAVTDADLKSLAKEYLIKYFPYTSQYKLPGDIELNDYDVEISNVTKDFVAGTLTFNYTINRFTTDKVSLNGSPVNMIVDLATHNILADFYASKNITPITSEATITGFNTIYGPTTVDNLGATVNSLSKYIATSEMDSNGINLNTIYGYNEKPGSIIDLLIDAIFANNLINNIPIDATKENVKIAITSVDNSSGILNIKVYMNKYYKNVDGKLVLINSETFDELENSTTVIGGFKSIPNSTTINSTVETDGIILSGVSDQQAGSISDSDLKQAVFKNINLIFDNLPSTSITPSTANMNNPGFDINCFNIVNKRVDGATITVDIELNSYFGNSDTYHTNVWFFNSTSKTFNNIVIKGFGEESTTIESKIYLDANDIPLVTLVPSDVYNNSKYENNLKQLVIDKALKGKIIENTTIANITILSYNSYSNMDGTLEIKVSLNKYHDISIGEVTNGSLEQTITIYGFTTTKPTTIDERYNGSSIQEISSIYAYQYTEDNIKNLLINQLIHNVPDSFSINNISIKSNSIRFDNFNGIVSFIPVLTNYYNDEGIPSQTSKEFNRVYIEGFLKVASQTTIKSNYIVSGYENSLAISYLNYQYKTEINGDSLKKLVIDNLIINGPVNLTENDIEISNIIVNNTTGMTRGITATVSLKKYIDVNGNLIDSNPLTQTITIGGFANVGSTSIESTITIGSEFQSKGAKQFLKENYEGSANQLDNTLRKLIFENIQNKWSANDTVDTTIEQKGAFINNTDNFRIANIEADNINGTISLDVGLYRYIDDNGVYHQINIGQQPLIFKVKITGFISVTSSEILDTYNFTNMNQVLASQYAPVSLEDNIFNSNLKTIIYDNLLVNKLVKWVITHPDKNDPSISVPEVGETITKETDIEIENMVSDNAAGTLTCTVKWKNNYYDYLGNEVKNGIGEAPTQTITFTGFKKLNTGTTVNPTINISADLPEGDSKPTAAEYSRVASSGTSDNRNKLQEFIYNNLNNIPFNITGFNPETGGITSQGMLINKEDINIINQIMSDGFTYYGFVNNIEGTLTVTFEIPTYYDTSGNLIQNRTPLRLTTTFTGFKPNTVTTTTVVPVIDLLDPNVAQEIQGLACSAYSQISSKEFEVNDTTKELLLATGSISGWEPTEITENNEQVVIDINDKTKWAKLYSKMNIQKVSYADGVAEISVQLLETINPDDGLTNSNWSKVYTVTIKGFKIYSPTYINTSLDLTNERSPDLSSYDKGTQYNSINVYNITDDDIKNIVQSQLLNIVKNPSPSIEEIASKSNIILSDFDKYIKVSITNKNGLDGTIQIQVTLYSYYDENGDLINNTVDDANAKSITSSITLLGFAKAKTTEINTIVTINDTRSPSELYEVPGRITNIIENNSHLFFNNLPQEFNFSNDMIITPVDYLNTTGTLTFKITLTKYYNDLGELIEGTGNALEKTVTINGLKQTNETTVRSSVDIKTDLGLTADLIELQSPTFVEIIKTSIISLQNNASTPTSKLIFSNLPFNSNKISSSDFTIDFNQNQIDFLSGTAVANVVLNQYYNELGVLIDDIPKNFSIVFTGFEKISEATFASSEPVDISSTNLSRYTLDKSNEADLNSSIPSNITNDILREMLKNLPSNANINNITKVEVDLDAIGTSVTEGTAWINITVNNSFVKDGNKIVQSFKENTFRVLLTGFAKMAPTSVKTTFDVSNSALSSISLNDANIASNILDVLNLDEIKKEILINPVYNLNQIIETNIVDLEVTEKDGPNGIAKVKFKINNYYIEKDGTVVVDENNSLTEYEITLTGFKKLPITNMKDNLIIPLQGVETTLPSEYVKGNLNAIKTILDSFKNELFIGDGWSTIKINEIVNPSFTSVADVDDASNQLVKNQVYANDVTGEIKLKFTYTGGYDQNANADDSIRKLSKTITLANFKKKTVTSWKSTANISKTEYVGVQMEKLTLTDPSFANLQVDSWDGTFTDGVSLNDLVKNSIVSDGASAISLDSQSGWVKNNKDGTATKLVTIFGWFAESINGNEMGSKTELTADSVLVQSTQKNVLIEVTGFNKVDLDKTQTSMYLLIGISCGLAAIVIIGLIALAFYKRRFH